MKLVLEATVYPLKNFEWAKKLADVNLLHLSTQLFKYCLECQLKFLGSAARCCNWFLAPRLWLSIMRKHVVVFVLCCFVYPIWQRLVISPIFRKLHYAFFILFLGRHIYERFKAGRHAWKMQQPTN